MSNNYVFISYSSKNYDSAKKIYDAMTAKGVSCWFDEVSIVGGENYAANIIKAIESCSSFILVLSKDSMASRNVASELNTAFQSGKLIIPFRIDNAPLTDDFEYYLNRSQWIDADSKVREAIDELYMVVTRQIYQQQNMAGDNGVAQSKQVNGGPVSYDTHTNVAGKKKKKFWWIPLVCGVGGGIILLVVLIVLLVNTISKQISNGISNIKEKTENSISNAQNWVDDTLSGVYSELDETLTGLENYTNELADNLNSDSEMIGIFALPVMEQVNAELQKDVKNTTGFTYQHAYVLSDGNGVSSATFYLGGNYDEFTFDLSCPDISSTNGFNWDVKVYLDGDIDNPEVIYNMSRSFVTHTVNLSTKGAKTITIWCEQKTLEYTGVMITNTTEMDPTNILHTPYDTGAESGRLLDQPLMEAYYSEIKTNITNNVGTVFDRGLLLSGDNSHSIATLYLGKRFDEVTFNISCPNDEYVSQGFIYQVYIYLNGQFNEPIKMYSMSTGFPPETITIDTHGADTIAFLVEQKVLEKTGLLITEVE